MRKWHRWLSIPSILFLSVVAVSGLVLQVQGFLNGDEEASEKLADTKSTVTATDMAARINFQSAQAALTAKAGNVHLKKVEIDFRSTPSTLTFYTEEPLPKEIQMEAATYKIISEKDFSENNFWIKLHSGEILGDAGRAVGIFGGLALLSLIISGAWIYFQMYSRRASGSPFWKRIFW